jgi:hypothetical protein
MSSMQMSEFTNAPFSFSLLHEQEYYNLCFLLHANKSTGKQRRACSEKSKQKNNVRNQTSVSVRPVNSLNGQ